MTSRANILLVLASTMITLLAAEAFLRIAQPGRSVRYAVWPPGLDQVIVPDARDTPGISETHHFKITAQGYRGRPMGDARLRIAAFGGSTTESLFVPEARSWPRLLEQWLAATLGVEVWVGNFGKSGRNTRQHILDATYVLPQFSVQVALFLVGVNDLGLAIDRTNRNPMRPDEIISDAYVKKSLDIPDAEPSSIRLLDLLIDAARSLSRPSGTTPSAQPPHITTDFYRRNRKQRAERAGSTSAIPDLGPWLDEYERNLSLIADRVRAQGVLPVFISQPTLWAAGLPNEVEARFWWGAVEGLDAEGAKTYYTPEAMQQMMKAYNGRLRAVASEKDVPLIDLARTLPKDAAYFYDEMHYNEAGSRAVADIIARDLATIIKKRGLMN